MSKYMERDISIIIFTAAGLATLDYSDGWAAIFINILSQHNFLTRRNAQNVLTCFICLFKVDGVLQNDFNFLDNIFLRYTRQRKKQNFKLRCIFRQDNTFSHSVSDTFLYMVGKKDLQISNIIEGSLSSANIRQL